MWSTEVHGLPSSAASRVRLHLHCEANIPRPLDTFGKQIGALRDGLSLGARGCPTAHDSLALEWPESLSHNMRVLALTGSAARAIGRWTEEER